MGTVAHERGKQAVYQWPQTTKPLTDRNVCDRIAFVIQTDYKHLQLFHKCHYPDFQDKDLIDLHKG